MYATVHLYYVLFMHSSVLGIHGYLRGFHLLATVNNASINVSIQVCILDPFNATGYMPRRRILGFYGNVIL